LLKKEDDLNFVNVRQLTFLSMKDDF
jgi:hypothetical protein